MIMTGLCGRSLIRPHIIPMRKDIREIQHQLEYLQINETNKHKAARTLSSVEEHKVRAAFLMLRYLGVRLAPPTLFFINTGVESPVAWPTN